MRPRPPGLAVSRAHRPHADDVAPVSSVGFSTPAVDVRAVDAAEISTDTRRSGRPAWRAPRDTRIVQRQIRGRPRPMTAEVELELDAARAPFWTISLGIMRRYLRAEPRGLPDLWI